MFSPRYPEAQNQNSSTVDKIHFSRRGAIRVEDIFQGQFSAAKYQSSNPISRHLVSGFLRALVDLVDLTGASEAHEVGCGEGQISGLLAQRGLRVRGSDLNLDALAVARGEARRKNLDIGYCQKNIYQLDAAVDSAQLMLCCEVLEHLIDPGVAMQRLTKCARGHVIVSVPREPLWRMLNMCRGYYLTSFGNTSGHLNHWSTAKFCAFVGQFLHIQHVRTPVPWTIISGRPR